MPLTIDPPSEMERRLSEEAARRHVSVSDCVIRLVDDQLKARTTPSVGRTDASAPRQVALGSDEWERAFRDWAASHDTATRPIPMDALRRENLYDGREW